MNDFKQSLWAVFANSGYINDYLKYKLIERNNLIFKAGEDFEFDKDDWNSDEDH